jgi:hypothetical protein
MSSISEQEKIKIFLAALCCVNDWPALTKSDKTFRIPYIWDLAEFIA